MKRNLATLVVLTVFCLGFGRLALGKEKKGPVSGTWACVAHGTGQGDISYTFTLTQTGAKVTGSFAANSGEETADLTDGSFKDKKLELHFDAYGGTISITGTMAKKGAMSGDWSHSGGGQGAWECTKSPAAAAGKK